MTAPAAQAWRYDSSARRRVLVVAGLLAAVRVLATGVPAHAQVCAWTVVPSPSPASLGNYLSAVTAVSATDVWAVGWSTVGSGYRLQTLVEHWDGTAWTVVPSPSPGTDYDVLYGIAAVSDADIWTVGYTYSPLLGYKTLIEHWDGTAWTVIPSPSPFQTNSLSSVAAISTADVWAVGGGANGIWDSATLVVHWDGIRWSLVTSPSPGRGHNTLGGVSATSSEDVWAAGVSAGGGADVWTGKVLFEHWDGVEWTVVPGAGSNSFGEEVAGIAALGENNVWAVGMSGVPAHEDGLIEHWNGVQWTVVPSPSGAPDIRMLLGVAAGSATDVWAVGFTGDPGRTRSQTLIEHWDGSTWSLVPSPSTGAVANALGGVAVVSQGDVWAVGRRDSQTLAEHYSCTD